MAYGLPIDLADSFPPGTFINGPTKFFEAIVNSCWELGIDNKADLEAAIANVVATHLNPDMAPTMTATTLTPETVAEPYVDIPPSASVDDVFDKFTTEYIELATWLATQFATFKTTHFPDEQLAYQAMEDWLEAAIANPEVGLPAAVADQIWTDDRDRITFETERALSDVFDAFAARRFPLPPGAAVAAIIKIEQTTQDKISESSRKVAIMSVEQMRFVVENLMKLRQTAMQAAVDYMKALASGPDMVSRMVNIGYDAQSKLISSVSSYYSARTQARELTFKGVQANATMAQDASKENLKSELVIIEERVKALLSQVQSLTQLAVSNFNNLHLQASQGNTVHAQETSTV